MPQAPTDRQPPAVPAPESAPLPPERQAGEAHGLALIAGLEARLALDTRIPGGSTPA